MAIKTMEKLITKDSGSANEIKCPACGETVSFRLFENIDLSLLNIVLKKENESAFAVCPKCAAVFGVNSNYIKERNNGTAVFLTESDLSKLEKSGKNE